MDLSKKVNDQEITVDLINESIDLLVSEDIGSDIRELRKELKKIRDELSSKKGGSQYSYIEILFKKTTKLELPKYGLETFDRNLKDRMYFSVVGGNEDAKYIDLRTKSFPEIFILRLHYKELEEFKKQKGKAQLIYQKGSERLEGDESSVEFEIKKLK